MKVLWISNILFPEASSIITGNSEFKNSGGWMLGAANALLDRSDVILAVATVSDKVREFKIIEGERIKYFIIPLGKGNLKYNKDYELYWKRINVDYSPDIIHIHGSEFSHGLSWVRANGARNVVVSIQGMPSVYKRFYYSGLSWLQVWEMCAYGVLSFFKITGKDKYVSQGNNEVDLLKSVNHIIGRTSWDRAHTWAINSKAEYHFCNETLRSVFYEGKWEYTQCRKHTIFLSQVGKPIKGFHQIIKALTLVLKDYPDTKVIVAGNNVKASNSIRTYLKNGYYRIVRKMIKKNNMEDVFEFVGPQDENGMKQYLLNSNVFVLSSSIENSPNSLGEAQLLGVPCISSYVGGVSDMIPNSRCGTTYRFSEYEMLAYSICTLFNDASSFDNLEMRIVARRRHDPVNNAIQTIKIYNDILGLKC